ncbi:hypothetical protein [Rhodovibrio salinarum]|uniref:hypothetical protein n=1 Tax=Rhodovibrio salinarum TaxID=1087 RepID=UPI0012DFCEDE|nr:hypothetical protein [Rhodovibrio salinarum]
MRTPFGSIDSDKLRHRLIVAQLVGAPVGLVVLGWLLVNELPLQQLQENWIGLASSVLLGLLGLELFGVRLWLMARLFALDAPVRAVWRVHVVTMFYYFFLPAGVGYDLVRAAKLGAASSRAGGWRLAGLASMERVAGGLGLVLLLLVGLPFTDFAQGSDLRWLNPSPRVWWTLVAGLVVLVGLVYLLARRRYPTLRLLYPATLVSALAYAVLAAGIWTAAEAWGVAIEPTEVLVALAGTLLFQLIPVNLVGVSFGEVAAVAIYMAYGLARPEAVLLTTVAYLQRLAAALAGGGLEGVASARWLLTRRQEGPVPADRPHPVDLTNPEPEQRR